MNNREKKCFQGTHYVKETDEKGILEIYSNEYYAHITLKEVPIMREKDLGFPS